MQQKDFFLELGQRNREWSRGEYYSTLDVIDRLDGQSTTLEGIRTAAVNFYRNEMPTAFAGLDRLAASSVDKIALMREQATLLSKQSDTLDEINDRLVQVRNSLDFGFDRLCVRLDQSNDYLSQVVDMLRGPTRTQAEEHARNAIRSLQNGWYEESMGYLNRVTALDPLNYAAWYYTGIINLEHFADQDAAVAAFSASQKYAKPDNAFYYSSSTYQLALIAYAGNQLELAIERATAAYGADNHNTQAAFLLAEVHAILDRPAESQKYLKLCEAADVIYFLKSANSKALIATGIQKSVYDSATADLGRHNAETLERFKLVRTVGDALRAEFEGIPREVIADDICEFAESVGRQSDYLANRVGHDRLIAMIQDWEQRYAAAMRTVESLVETRRYAVGQVPNVARVDFKGNAPAWLTALQTALLIVAFFFGLISSQRTGSLLFIVLSLPIGVALGFAVHWFVNRPVEFFWRQSKQTALDEQHNREEANRRKEVARLQSAENTGRRILDAVRSAVDTIGNRDFYSLALVVDISSKLSELDIGFLRELKRNGKSAEAIKLYRERTGADFGQALDAMQKI